MEVGWLPVTLVRCHDCPGAGWSWHTAPVRPVKGHFWSRTLLGRSITEQIRPVTERNGLVTGFGRPVTERNRPVMGLDGPVTERDRPVMVLNRPVMLLAWPVFDGL